MAKYRITDPQSGRTVTVSGSKPPTQQEAEQIFQDAGLRGGQGANPLQGVQQAAQFLAPETSKLPGKIANKEVFGSDTTIIPADQIPRPDETKGNPGKAAESSFKKMVNLLGTAARPAVELASYRVPMGKSLKANTLWGMLSGGMFGAAQEDATPGDVLTTTGAGGLFGAGTGAVSKLAGSTLTKLGEKATDAGKDLVLRVLRPTKTQLSNFSKKTGQDLGDFLKAEGITDDFVSQATERLAGLQQQFDDLAMREGVTLRTDQVRQAFEEPIKNLSKSVIPSVKAKGEQLKQVVDNIAQEYGDDLPLAELTNIRRQFDALLADRQFGLSPYEANYLKSARDATQQLIQETTDKFGKSGDLKRLGQQMNRYIELEKIAQRQGNLGRGTGLFQLSDLVIGAGGLATGNPLAPLLGIGLNRARQSPRILSGASDLLEGAGQTLQNMNLPQVPDQLMQLFRGAAESGSTPKRAPNNEKEDPMGAMRRAQDRQNLAYQRRPGLLP